MCRQYCRATWREYYTRYQRDKQNEKQKQKQKTKQNKTRKKIKTTKHVAKLPVKRISMVVLEIFAEDLGKIKSQYLTLKLH